MKKILSIVLVLSLIGLSGCAFLPINPIVSTETDSTLAETQAATQPQPQPTTEEVPHNLVEDAFTKVYKYTATDYDHSSGTTKEVGQTVQYHIPRINLPGEAIAQINRDIVATFQETIDFSEEAMKTDGYPVSNEILYEWTVNGDILSLMVCNSLFSEYGGSQYLVYNISLSAGDVANRGDVLAAAGLTEEQFLSLAKTNIQDYFMASFESDKIPDEFLGLIYEQLHRTIADENLKEAMIYLNDQCQLCIIWRNYSIAGADYYWHTMNLTEYSLTD